MNREAQLRQVYQGKFEDRPRFDGGGYVDYASMPSSAQYYATDGGGGVTPPMAPITVTPTSYTPQSQAPVTLNAADTAGIAGIGSPVTTDQAQQAADGLASGVAEFSFEQIVAGCRRQGEFEAQFAAAERLDPAVLLGLNHLGFSVGALSPSDA